MHLASARVQASAPRVAFLLIISDGVGRCTADVEIYIESSSNRASRPISPTNSRYGRSSLSGKILPPHALTLGELTGRRGD
jgi:hypothetical protein